MKEKTIVRRMPQRSGILFLIIGLMIANGCSKKESTEIKEKRGNKMIVQVGDKVKIEYTGKFKDGVVFDKSEGRGPLEFTVGDGQVIPGFEEAVKGMKLNEEKEVDINPQNAYGDRDESLQKELPRTSFPENFQPEKDMIIKLQDQSGRVIPAKIVGVAKEGGITVDLNHPLAGKDLNFLIKVVGIE